MGCSIARYMTAARATMRSVRYVFRCVSNKAVIVATGNNHMIRKNYKFFVMISRN